MSGRAVVMSARSWLGTPFAHQALLRADARTQEAAQGFLNAAARAAQAAQTSGPHDQGISFRECPYECHC